MDLKQIVRRVQANWIVALVTFLACVGIGFIYAVLPAKQYEASVLLIAQPPPNTGNAGTDVGAIQIEIPQIVVEAENGSVQEAARALVPARYRNDPVTITATGDPASNSVTINAKSTNPAAAQAYADAAASRVLKVTNRDAASLLVLSELGAAELPTTPTNPAKTVAVASVALGVILGIFAALAAAAIRRTGPADELWDRLGLPVLGEVPTLVGADGNPADMFGPTGDETGLEAFQQLRSFLHIKFQGSHPVIAFTSCDPKEGKSSIASHTAWALATPGAICRGRRRRSAPTEAGPDFRSEPLAWRQRHFGGKRPLRAPCLHGKSLSGGHPGRCVATTPGRRGSGGYSEVAPCPPRVGPDGCPRLPAHQRCGGDDHLRGRGGRCRPGGRCPQVQPRSS